MKKGDVVAVINRQLSGPFAVEGHATVIRNLGNGRALVRFENHDEPVERFVNPEAQADPESYAASMNQRCGFQP